MNTHRKTAIAVGILYVTGTIAGILSLFFTQGLQEGQDFLIEVSTHDSQLVMGAFCVLVMSLSLAMIPVLMFPILRKYNEALALGYVVFRGALETFTYLAMVISWLSLLPLSHIYAQADVSDSANLQALGNFLIGVEAIAPVLAIVFCLGALMFYTVLYQSKLVPRWLSVWGLIGAVLYLAGGLLVFFALIDPISSINVASNIPLALQEMLLALWLIGKGFNTSAKIYAND